MEFTNFEMSLITNALAKELFAIETNENLTDFMKHYKSEKIEKLLNKIKQNQ